VKADRLGLPSEATRQLRGILGHHGLRDERGPLLSAGLELAGREKLLRRPVTRATGGPAGTASS
jgi:hypothetical protein